MAEIGIDISDQRSKGLDEVTVPSHGTVATLCAEQVCPVVSGRVTHLHWPIEDPAAGGTAEDFTRACDELARRLDEWLASEASGHGHSAAR